MNLFTMPVRIICTLWLVLTLLGCVSGKTSSVEIKPTAQILTAQRIISMAADSFNDQATAVAFSEGKIIGLGTLGELQAQLSDYHVTVDTQFADKVIMPGFIDNHLHPALAGILLPSQFITPYSWHLPNQKVDGVIGRDAYLEKLQELESNLSYTASEAPEQMLFSWGYHQYFHGKLTRADLDAISSDRPIIIFHRSFHEVIANSAAINKLELKPEDYANHPSINFEDGHFWELGLFAIYSKLAPILMHPARYHRGVLEGFVHAQSNGITTLADQGSPLMNLEVELSAIHSMLEKYDLPIRMLMIGNGKTLAVNGFNESLKLVDGLSQHDTSRLQFLPKQVKFLADGAFYSQLMQMEDGYLDGHHGEWIMPPEELREAASVFWKENYQLHIHVNGDKGVNVVLDIIEDLNREFPRQDHRTVLHHYGYSSADQAERVAQLGVLVSANPFYLWALGDKYAEIGLGPERAHNITRLGDLERNGVSVSFHSDLPMAPASPLTLAGIAASRVSAQGNLLAPNERMSVEAALRGITLDAAAAIGQEEHIGSIEIGKNADLVVLSDDPLAMDPQNFKDIKVIGTIYGGNYVANPLGPHQNSPAQ